MSCIEDYPIIEQAIRYGVKSWGKEDAMAIQIAGFWIEGWITAKKNELTDEDINIIRNGVKNFYFM